MALKNKIAHDLKKQDQKIDKQDQKIEKLDQKIEKLDQKIEKVSQDFAEMKRESDDLKSYFAPSVMVYFIGQMLIWSNYVNFPDSKIDSLEKILGSGYVQMTIAVCAFPTIVNLIRDHQKVLSAWIQLSSIFIVVWPIFQAIFIRDVEFHLRMSLASFGVIGVLFVLFLYQQNK